MSSAPLPCALCRKEALLMRSHILPKFAQRRMRKDGTPILSQRTAASKAVSVQDFAREALLCKDCELRFSRWEDRAARVFNQKRSFDLPLLPVGKAYVIHDLEYSTRQEFREVKLGHHQEIIRRMLLNESPGAADDYGCMMQVVTDQGVRIPVTRPADRHRTNSLTVQYRLLLDGFLLIWFVGAKEARRRADLGDFLIREDGSWSILIQRRIDIPFLREALAPVLRPQKL